MEEVLPVFTAIFIEAFVSIHMSLFVLYPLSRIYCPRNSKKAFITLFIIRAVFLIYADIFISTTVAICDFFMVFVGVFILVPISALIMRRNIGEVFQSGQLEFSKRLRDMMEKTNDSNNEKQWDINFENDDSIINHEEVNNKIEKNSVIKNNENAVIKEKNKHNDEVIKFK